jgi:hypothetical protein
MNFNEIARPRKCGFILIIFCFLSLVMASVVPFNGSSGGTYAFTSPTTATADSLGNSTIIGPFRSHEELNLTATGIEGTITWMSADGSTMVAVVAGTFTSATTVAGTYLVTGGTGRFEGASGSASFNATLLGPDTSFSGQLTSH